MDATRAIQDSIHVFSLVRKYVSRILGTYQYEGHAFLGSMLQISTCSISILPDPQRCLHASHWRRCP